MSRADYGRVELELDGEEVILEPTLKAMRAIKMRWPNGGIQAAIGACSQMDADDLAYMIAAGSGIDKKEAGELPEKVFNEGVAEVAPYVVRWLTLLMHPTGKTEATEDDGSGE